MTWEIAILATIGWLDGEAWLWQIYGEIVYYRTLTVAHWAANLDWGDRPVYQHTVRACISNLCEQGELTRVARGRYRLTEKGRKRLTDEG